jgi:hypothetical protein
MTRKRKLVWVVLASFVVGCMAQVDEMEPDDIDVEESARQVSESLYRPADLGVEDVGSGGECLEGPGISLGGCLSYFDWDWCQGVCRGYGYDVGYLHCNPGDECGSAWACCCVDNNN